MTRTFIIEVHRRLLALYESAETASQNTKKRCLCVVFDVRHEQSRVIALISLTLLRSKCHFLCNLCKTTFETAGGVSKTLIDQTCVTSL